MKKSHKIQIFKKSDKTKQNISQKVDSGRSMVEMLGVLAVIGVLSVASILGYRYAMAKWRANETVNELNIRAYDIATRFDKLVASNTREIEMEMGDTTKLGYPITARISPQYEDYFEMFVSNVPTDVCKELLNSQWQAPYSIFVGIEEYEASADICEQADNVQLAYEFYKDLSNRDELPEEIQHKVQRCNHNNNCQCGECNEEIGLCESYCHDGEVCKKDYDDLTTRICCDSERAQGDFCCAYIENGKCCDSQGICCPADKPLMDQYGKCHACDEKGTVYLFGLYGRCANKCPDERTMADYRSCTLKCPADQLLDTSGKCRSCDDEAQVINIEDRSLCTATCTNRVLSSGLYNGCAKPCPPEKPLMDKNGYCHACDEKGTVYLHGVYNRCADACSAERIMADYQSCVLRECTSDQLLDTSGKCRSCDDEAQVINIEDRSLCTTTCTNRVLSSGLYNGCAKPCPPEKPLMDKNGYCHACDEKGTVYLHGVYNRCADACSAERIMADYQSCVLRKCPENTIRDTDGSCRTCSDAEPILDSKSNCVSCNYKDNAQTVNCDKCTNRIIENNACVWQKCSNGYFEGLNGECYACNIATAVSVKDEEACKACINRTYKDGMCMENS